MGFSLRGRPCVNNPNAIFPTVGMCEEQDALLAGRADRDKPILVQRMVWVVEGQREWIHEDAGGLLE